MVTAVAVALMAFLGVVVVAAVSPGLTWVLPRQRNRNGETPMATTNRNVTINIDGHTFVLDTGWVLATKRWEGAPAGESSDRLLAFLGLLLEDDGVETPKLPDDQAFHDRQLAALEEFATRLPDVQELTGARWDKTGQRLTLKST